MRTFKFLLAAFWLALFPVCFSSCEQPSSPEDSENTEKPNNPDTPDNPDDPDTPDNPDDPDTPDNPDNPDDPTTPDTPEDSETAIIGSWKLTKVIRQNSEGASEDLVSLAGQLWTFDQTDLTVDYQEFEYSISGTQLTTSYASTYETTFFTIQKLSPKSLTLYASHEERDKVGKRLIYYTFIFERVN